MAYKQWVKDNEVEPKLPGLDYTPEQMFWIAAAQTWCSKYRKGRIKINRNYFLFLLSFCFVYNLLESLKMRITTGVHSPGEFRVLGTMRNLKYFSHDFQCPEGSPMNPVHKCEVW